MKSCSSVDLRTYLAPMRMVESYFVCFTLYNSTLSLYTGSVIIVHHHDLSCQMFNNSEIKNVIK